MITDDELQRRMAAKLLGHPQADMSRVVVETRRVRLPRPEAKTRQHVEFEPAPYKDGDADYGFYSVVIVGNGHRVIIGHEFSREEASELQPRIEATGMVVEWVRG